MKQDLVTVIIPVYNIAPYIANCLDSVISQEYKNLEIIVVNDGSTDNTVEIINKYVNIDHRIILINQSNSGVSEARNKALNCAQGKYMTFIDGDDWVAPDYISEMYSKIKEFDADIVKCGFEFINIETGKFRRYKEKLKLLSKKQALQDYMSGRAISSSVWGTLYKKSLFTCDIRFDSSVKIGEDGQMTLMILNKATKVLTIPKILYYIRVRVGSASRSNILISDECKILDKITLPDYIDNRYVEGYKLRVATSLLLKNSFNVSKQQYLDLKNQLNYQRINKHSVRCVLSPRWTIVSLLGKSKYGILHVARILKKIGLKPAF